MVVMVHSSDDSEDEENELLVTALRHQSNRILRAEGLATGFCKDIHGQVNPPTHPTPASSFSSSEALAYISLYFWFSISTSPF